MVCTCGQCLLYCSARAVWLQFKTTGEAGQLDQLDGDGPYQELMNRYERRSVKLAYLSCVESHFQNVPYTDFNLC